MRPLGSKHCGVLNKCVSRFDHFCPWVGNAIGKGNIRDFISFLLLESTALVCSLLAAFARMHSSPLSLAELFGAAPLFLVFVIAAAITTFPVLMLTAAQIHQMTRNITTNELANMHRYQYLRTKDGRFQNPCVPPDRHSLPCRKALVTLFDLLSGLRNAASTRAASATAWSSF